VGWTIFCLFLAFIIFGLIVPGCCQVSEKARMMQGYGNARQIIITLKNYAADHGGRYPEGKTSNDVFRELFKAGLLEDERPFTVAYSPYEGDNNIGEKPDFEEALKPGENHWAMTRGLTDKSVGESPLIFENPVEPTWPPRWNADAAGQKQPGRAWKNGWILVGRNDGSVSHELLESMKGAAVGLKRGSDGKNLFEAIGPHEVIDIDRPAK
jgi:hypothetical protein